MRSVECAPYAPAHIVHNPGSSGCEIRRDRAFLRGWAAKQTVAPRPVGIDITLDATRIVMPDDTLPQELALASVWRARHMRNLFRLPAMSSFYGGTTTFMYA
jgi:hypothetical protein